MQTFGSRRQVFNGNAKKTNGGLIKKDLKKNKHGRIVSVRASKSAKKNNHLKKAGWTTQKGVFGAVKVEEKKSKSNKKKSKGKKR
jgi:hypothetical protein